MIPVLYEAKTRTFETNGIGRLHFTKCVVKETMNGEFELEGEITTLDKHFKDIENDRILYVSCEVDNDNQAFRIYNVEKKDKGTVTVHAEHISYWLSRIPVWPFEAMTAKESIERIMERTMEENPFTLSTDVTYHPYVWTDENNGIEIYKWSEDYPEPLVVNPLDEESKKPAELMAEEPYSVKHLMGDDENTGILGVFKSGEWKYNNFNCKLLNRRGVDTDIVLRYGKNLKTLTQDENIQNMITGLLPFYKHTCTRKANEDFSEEDKKRYLSAESIIRIRDIFIPPYDPSDPGDVERTVWCMLPHDHRWHTDNVDKFAFPRDEILDCSSVFDHSPSYKEIWYYTNAYADQHNIGIPELSLKIDFEYLWQLDERPIVATLEKLHMGDSLHVAFPKLEVTATGEVIEYEWDVLTNKYNSITIGNVTHSIVDTIKNYTRATMEEPLKFVATKWEQLKNGIMVLNKLYYKGTGQNDTDPVVSE